MQEKTLTNTSIADVKASTSDVEVFGNGDMWQLLSKASSKSQGWMKSCKAMEVAGVGCMVQVTTQQRNPDGSYVVAEAVSTMFDTRIVVDKDGLGNVIGRHLEKV
jgi:Lon protease-like protein